jgi:hypothetical protein
MTRRVGGDFRLHRRGKIVVETCGHGSGCACPRRHRLRSARQGHRPRRSSFGPPTWYARHPAPTELPRDGRPPALGGTHPPRTEAAFADTHDQGREAWLEHRAREVWSNRAPAGVCGANRVYTAAGAKPRSTQFGVRHKRLAKPTADLAAKRSERSLAGAMVRGVANPSKYVHIRTFTLSDGPLPNARARSGSTSGACAARWTRASPRS